MLKSNSRRLFQLATGYIPMPEPPPLVAADVSGPHFAEVYTQYYQDVQRSNRLTWALVTTGVVLGVASNWPPETAAKEAAESVEGAEAAEGTESAENRPHKTLMLCGGLAGGFYGLLVGLVPIVGVPWAAYYASTSPDFLRLVWKKKQDGWTVTFFKK
jgi:hypothetical protein